MYAAYNCALSQYRFSSNTVYVYAVLCLHLLHRALAVAVAAIVALAESRAVLCFHLRENVSVFSLLHQ
jgi:hypothetical protein